LFHQLLSMSSGSFQDEAMADSADDGFTSNHPEQHHDDHYVAHSPMRIIQVAAPAQTSIGGGVVPDIMMLGLYCARTQAPRDGSDQALQQAAISWEPVREWIQTHNDEEIRDAARQLGESSMTPL
jgi:hypothetical protein